MADKPRDVIVPIVFDEEALVTDLGHLGDAAGAAVRTPRREIDHDHRIPRRD